MCNIMPHLFPVIFADIIMNGWLGDAVKCQLLHPHDLKTM